MNEEKDCRNCGNIRTDACHKCTTTEFEGKRVATPSNWIPIKSEKKMQNTEAVEAIIRALGCLEGISYAVEGNLASGIIDAVQAIDESLKEIVLWQLN